MKQDIKKKRVGIVGAQLQGVKTVYTGLALEVAKNGYESRCFISIPDGDVTKCSWHESKKTYHEQMKELDKCDLVIAYVGEVVTDVVVKLEHCNAKGIPVVLFFKKGRRVSPLLLGGPMVKNVYQYNKQEVLMGWVKDMLKFADND